MIELNPEIVRQVIDMSHQIQAKEGASAPDEDEGADGDWARQILADHANDPVAGELTSMIDDLEPDQQVTLVALMWLGRGDFELDEWEAALSAAGDAWNTRTAAYVIGTPHAADYLAEGLSQHGYDT